MSNLMQKKEQNGYALGGLNRRYLESIENDIEFDLPTNKKSE